MTFFRPLSYYENVPPFPFQGLANYTAELPPRDSWPAASGGPARMSRSADPLVEDQWTIRWQAALGDAERPDSLLVGRGRIVVNGADHRGVWADDGRQLGFIPRTRGTTLLDLPAGRFLFDDQGGITVYDLDARRQASLVLSFPVSGSVREILHGPGVLVIVSAHAPAHGTSQVVVEAIRIIDYANIKNGILYGIDPLAGIVGEGDATVRAAASRHGPVLATEAGILWCDWQLKTLAECETSGTPMALSTDDTGRAYLLSDDMGEMRLRIVSPGGPVLADVPLSSTTYRLAGPPVVASTGQLYLPAPDALLAAAPDGQVLWEQSRTAGTRATVSLNNLLVTASESLDAITADGRHLPLWSPASRILTPPVMASGLIYVATAEALFVLEPASSGPR